MTRTSKQEERRHRCPRKRHGRIIVKTGPKVDSLENGYKEHANALPAEAAIKAFIPKIK